MIRRVQLSTSVRLVIVLSFLLTCSIFGLFQRQALVSASTTQTQATLMFSWKSLAAIPQARYESQGKIVDGKLYVIGGFTTNAPNIQTTASVYAYNISANTWQRKADMPEQITHAPTVVYNGVIYLLGGYVGNNPGGSTTHVWMYDTQTNTWSRGPDLPASRGGGTAALLGTTIHFVSGATRTKGIFDDTDYPDHYTLDLSQENPIWQTAKPIPMARNHLGGVAFRDKFYVIGGQLQKHEGTSNQSRVDVYDPATDTWSRVADMPIGRGHITESTLVVNDRIVVIGGSVDNAPGAGDYGDASSDVLIYDPVTNVWIRGPSIPHYRKTPVADVIGNTIYISTGGGYGPTSTTWVGTLPPTWETGATMNVSLGEVASGIIGNKMYVVGEASNSTTSYDFSTNTWTAMNLTKRPFQGNHHAAEVVDGQWYLFGGLGAGGGKVQVYNPLSNTWTLRTDMPFAAGSSSSALINGKVYVAGGIVYTGSSGSTTNRVAMYDPATDTWTEKAAMPQGRNHAASATDGSKLYVFGGRGAGSGDDNTVANGFATVQVYDPATDTWQSSDDVGSGIAPLPQARGGMGKAVYYNGEFYVLGGETLNGAGATANKVYDRVDIYNPTTNTWRLGTSMPTARHGIFPVVIGQRIYVAGGGIKSGYSNSTILEIYNPAGEVKPPVPTITPTATATNTAIPTNPPTATSTLEPTATNTAEPTATSTIEPTVTNTPEPTVTAVPTLTIQPTAVTTTPVTTEVVPTPQQLVYIPIVLNP